VHAASTVSIAKDIFVLIDPPIFFAIVLARVAHRKPPSAPIFPHSFANSDGLRFCGRGLIQVTGRRNYTLAAIGLDLDLLHHPELLEQPTNAAMSAAWYWSIRKLNALADAGDFLGVSRAVNLGSAVSKATPNGYS
jgi:putative chitinase